MNVLGLSCYFHDAAAALVQDGRLVAAAEEERFSRVKHDPGFPGRALRFCLAKAGLDARDLDWVVFFEKPFVKFERILLSALGTWPRSHGVFREAMSAWFTDKLWIRNTIRRELGVAPDRILFGEHHVSHAASAFYCSPFEEAAVLTVDGVGEWTTASLGVGRGTDVQLLAEIAYPHSLGLLYSAFTAFLGFEVNEGEYKVMGMAPYGTPRYVDEVRRVVRVHGDGSFELDLDYFEFHRSTERTYSPRFAALFGEARDPALPFFTANTDWPSYYGAKPGNFQELAVRNQRWADLAASVQVVTEEILLGLARDLHRRTGLDRLCLAGGVALNSVANGRILRETPFRDVFVQPAAGDSGAALGAALWATHAVHGRPRAFTLEHAYWGEAHDDGAVADFLAREGVLAEQLDDDRLVDRVASALAGGAVVGWARGPFEWGPRALGNRSILADPRRPEMKDLVNTKVKFREPFRPFAPSVPASRAAEFFAVDDPKRAWPARFMAMVAPVLEGQRGRVPATTHVDGSARLQTVFPESSPVYHRLIERFGEATGVPVLLNTSFNLRGEPIVNTPAEAYSTFRRSELDLLVLGNWLVRKPRA